jgi:hypothetical protein
MIGALHDEWNATTPPAWIGTLVRNGISAYTIAAVATMRPTTSGRRLVLTPAG